MRSLHDGRRRENIGHSTSLKPVSPLAHSLHIKQEVGLTQDCNDDSPPNLCHNNTSRLPELLPSLSRNNASSWGAKTQFGALLKLRANGGAVDHIKDLPSLLEAAGLFTKSPTCGKGILQEGSRDQGLTLSHSPPVDLKIPQVRGLSMGVDLSWGSFPSEQSNYPHCDSLGKRLRSILPKHGFRGSNGGLDVLGGEKDYWPLDTEHQTSSSGGGPYPTSDPEGDLGSKQPRKKRGRYRQYNTELLEEAIGVVMGGKMSVSKAQTVYGIPHSTLEYKVKERLGTLKHPPKKKLKLMSRSEEPEGLEAPESLEGAFQDSQHTEDKEPVSSKNGRELLYAGLSSDE